MHAPLGTAEKQDCLRSRLQVAEFKFPEQASRPQEAQLRDSPCIQEQSQLQKLQTAKLSMPNNPVSTFRQSGVWL